MKYEKGHLRAKVNVTQVLNVSFYANMKKFWADYFAKIQQVIKYSYI